MRSKVICIIAVAAGLGWVFAATPSAEAQCSGSSPTGAAAAAPNRTCGSGSEKPTAVAGPAGAAGKKCCGTCAKSKAAAPAKCCGTCAKSKDAAPAKCCGTCGKKACGPTCTKACCAGKPVAAQAHLAAAEKHLDAAHKAIEAGNHKAALAALAQARKLIALERGAADKKVAAFANGSCPMTGRPVRPGFTRVFKGRVVGFCGPGCASHWDNASDAKKAAVAAKLAAKGPAGPTGPVDKADHHGHHHDHGAHK